MIFTNTADQIRTPQFLNKSRTYTEKILVPFQQYAKKKGVQLWCGECAAAIKSGQDNTTNGFVDGFW
jgi:hypothetical protein